MAAPPSLFGEHTSSSLARRVVIDWQRRQARRPLIALHEQPASPRMGPDTLLEQAETRTSVPFPFTLPTMPPPCWCLSEQVQAGYPEGRGDVQVEWINPGHPSVYLSSFQSAEGSLIPQLIGPESYQEIQIHGQPAVLAHGSWDSATRQSTHSDAKTILWAVDGVQYALWTSDSNVTAADLIAMAESTP